MSRQYTDRGVACKYEDRGVGESELSDPVLTFGHTWLPREVSTLPGPSK